MTHEIQLQAAGDELRTLQNAREPAQGRVRALIGDGAGNLTGNNGAPWVLCRLGGDVNQLVQAYNGTTLVPSENMSIMLLVRYKEGRVDHYEIERSSGSETWPGYVAGIGGGVAAHHLSHEYGQGSIVGGWDAVNVYERMFTSLRPNAQTTPNLTLYVHPGYYNINGVEYFFAGGNTGAFTPPGSGSEYDVVTLDAAGALNITVAGLTSPPATFVLPSGEVPIVAAYLTAGQTSILESDILDIRPFLSLSSAGTPYVLTVKEVDGSPSVSGVTTIRVSNGTLTNDGGGQVTIDTDGTPHDLLDGAQDQDTVAHSVVRGDLITGNSTPKWGALAIGTSARLLQSNGTDPSWVALSGDATVASGGALTLATTAVTPGTYGDATHVAQVTVDAKGRLTAAANVAITGGSGGSSTLIGLARWSITAGETTFDLPDVAEYIISVLQEGIEIDPLLYTLSADRTQLILDSGPPGDATLVCHYVVAQV